MKKDEKFNYFKNSITFISMILIEPIMFWIMTRSGLVEKWQMPMFLLFISLFTTFTYILFSTEVIREIKEDLNMILLFGLTIFQFILFFAVQYYYLVKICSNSFSGLSYTAIDYFYQSTMIFFMNPLITPNTDTARILILINIFGAVSIILFILQNIWQFREQSKNL